MAAFPAASTDAPPGSDLVGAVIVTATTLNLAVFGAVATLLSHRLLLLATLGLAAILPRSAFALATVLLGGRLAFESHEINVGTARLSTERNRNQ